MLRRRTALVLASPLALTLFLGPLAGAASDNGTVGGTAAAAAAPQAGGSHRSHPQANVIRGEVGPGFTITFDRTSVPKGRYKIVVQDRSSSHNFHLTGRGVDESTTVPFVGKEVWRVALRQGSYRAQCDPHASSMNTSLQVTG